MNFIPSDCRIGVLGGGQLGKMLAQEASKMDLNIHFLDKDKSYPVASVCPNFSEGDFKDREAVIKFGADKDIITIEIENVNTAALHELVKQGKEVYPQPSILDMIRDKGLQKNYYKDHQFATAAYTLYEDKASVLEAIRNSELHFPFVQKLRTGGYDGKGVQLIKDSNQINLLMEGSSVIENVADIKKEISVIAVRNTKAEVICYPPVSMDFHPQANLVEALVCPAEISEIAVKNSMQLAKALAEKLEIVGLLAVEMFLLNNDEIWINEIAPRPHNSGHHTLDNGATSQFENHLRAIMGLPLGNTDYKQHAIMLNILGEEGFEGKPIYKDLDKILGIDGIHIHLYGKTITKPFRKMGHLTITGDDLQSCKQKATFVTQTLKVIA